MDRAAATIQRVWLRRALVRDAMASLADDILDEDDERDRFYTLVSVPPKNDAHFWHRCRLYDSVSRRRCLATLDKHRAVRADD